MPHQVEAEPYAPTAMMVSSSLPDKGLFGGETLEGTLVESGTSSITPIEEQRFVQLEHTIRTGIAVFYAVGGALVEIREKRLYRANHTTFEDYCQKQWGMTRQHANRMISAAQIVNELEPTGSIPTSEAVARPLSRLPPELREKAWQLAQKWAGVGAVTAAIVEQAAEEILPKEAKVQRQPQEEHPALFEDETPVESRSPEQEIAEEENIDEDQVELESAPAPTQDTPSSQTEAAPPAQPSPAPPKPTPAPVAKPPVAPTPVATVAPKTPAGFISTFVPEADCFWLQDAGFSMQEIFSTMKELVELGQVRGLSPDDLLTTLRTTLGLDDEEEEAS